MISLNDEMLAKVDKLRTALTAQHCAEGEYPCVTEDKWAGHVKTTGPRKIRRQLRERVRAIFKKHGLHIPYATYIDSNRMCVELKWIPRKGTVAWEVVQTMRALEEMDKRRQPVTKVSDFVTVTVDADRLWIDEISKNINKPPGRVHNQVFRDHQTMTDEEAQRAANFTREFEVMMSKDGPLAKIINEPGVGQNRPQDSMPWMDFSGKHYSYKGDSLQARAPGFSPQEIAYRKRCCETLLKNLLMKYGLGTAHFSMTMDEEGKVQCHFDYPEGSQEYEFMSTVSALSRMERRRA